MTLTTCLRGLLGAAALVCVQASARAQPLDDEPGIVQPGSAAQPPASAPVSAPATRPAAPVAPPPPAPAREGLEELVQRLQRSPDPRARHAAARRLGRLGDQRAGPPLAWALQQDPAPPVRAAAAISLGQLRINAAVPHLQAAAVHDRADEVRGAALAALERFGVGAAPAAYDRKAQEHMLLAKDETYVSGRRFRGAGIGVLAGGVGGGLLLGAFGLGVAGAGCGSSGCGDMEIAVGMWITGAVLATVGLGAGIPMIVVGQGRINTARKRAGLALLRRRGPLVAVTRTQMLRFGWTF